MHIFDNRNNLSSWRIQIALKYSASLWSASWIKNPANIPLKSAGQKGQKDLGWKCSSCLTTHIGQRQKNLGSVLNQSGSFSWKFHRAALILEIQHRDLNFLFHLMCSVVVFRSVSCWIHLLSVWWCLERAAMGDLRCLEKESPWGEKIKDNIQKNRKTWCWFFPFPGPSFIIPSP